MKKTKLITLILLSSLFIFSCSIDLFNITDDPSDSKDSPGNSNGQSTPDNPFSTGTPVNTANPNNTSNPISSSSPTTGDSNSPQVGSVINPSILASYYPNPLKVGMAWTYAVRTPQDPNGDYNYTLEITGLPADKVKLRYKLGTSVLDREVSLNDFLTGNASSEIPGKYTSVLTSEGVESLTVPAGTFPNAFKVKNQVTFEGQSSFFTSLWYVKGYGFVKLSGTINGVSTTTQLTEFKNG
jgi:hypothetical protein